MQSSYMQLILQRAGLSFIPRIDQKKIREVNNLDDALQTTKLLSSALFIRQSSVPEEFATEPPPIKESV